MKKRITPVSKIDKIETEINKIVGEVFFQKQRLPDLAENWVPWLDVSEKTDEVTVEVELPGISPKDITIMLNCNRIEIKGYKRRGRFSSRVEYLRLEREYGPFHRSISLPGAVVPEKAVATLKNGVLILVLKKPSIKKGKKVVLEIKKTED